MARRWLVRPRSLVFIPLLLVLVIAVACGEDATSTPRPTATAAPTTAPPPATPTTAAMQPTATTAGMQPTATTAPTKAAATATSTPRPTPTPTSVPQPVVDRLVVVAAPPLRESMVPWLSTAILFMVRPMYESIIGTDPSTGLNAPELATQWEMSPDGKAWTLGLVEGVPFHFGFGDFTAQDVIHSWERLVSDESLASDKPLWADLVTSTDGFDVVSDREIVINLARPEPDLDFMLSARISNFIISSKRQWDEQGTDGSRHQPSGTGPYRYVDNKTDTFVLYERVENHWRQTPEFKELDIRIVKENATKLAMILTEEAHIVDLPRDLHEEAISRGKKRIVASMPKSSWVAFWGGLYFAETEFLDLTVPWTDKRVREALNRAIDREEMLETIFKGRGTMAGPYGFLPFTQGWDPSWPDRLVNDEYKYDPERSRELLAEAGYADGFELKIYNYPYRFPELAQMFEALAQYFIEVGVDAKVQDVDYAVVRGPLRGRTLDGMMGWGPYSSGQPHTLVYSINLAAGGSPQYQSPYIEERMAAMAQTVDAAERDRLQREIGEHKFTEYAELPMFYTPVEAIIDPAVVAEYKIPGTHGDLFTHLEFVKAVTQ